MAIPKVAKIIREVPESGTFLSVRNSASQNDPKRIWSRSLKVTLFWIGLDILSVLIAAAVAVREYLGPWLGSNGQILRVGMLASARMLSLGYLTWFIIALILVSRRMHLYAAIEARNTLHDLRLSIQACFTAGLLLSGALYFARGEVVSRGVVILTILLTTMLIVVRRLVWRYVVYRRYERGMEARNILVVGTGRVGQALRHHVEGIRHLGYTFKGFVTIPGMDGDSNVKPGEILGSFDEILEVARLHFVDEIFLCSPVEPGLVKSLVEQARDVSVDIRVVPELYDGLAWNSPVEYIGQFPTISLHRSDVPVIGLMMKRILDILLAGAALIVLSPLLLLIAIAVKMDSNGPVFYGSERIGKKGRTFRCFKFRTMVPDAEKRRAEILHMNERDSILFKITNDPRITRVGAILRKYSLDEIPQFFNVVRGDMSLVGPRPPIASEVKKYQLNHLRRLDVTPGITGLWQVQARQDPSFDSYISLDTAYVENWSLWLDFKILVRTFAVVIGGTGA
jgi:exopolysaccharide biosynthesis polyprenyl glycosylphosphotransferase